MEICFEVKRNGTIKKIELPKEKLPVGKVEFDPFGHHIAVIYAAKDVKAAMAMEVAELNKSFLQGLCRIVH